MLTLAEEIVLLTLEDESGKFVNVPDHAVSHALSGAVLMDLAFEGRIDTDPERLFVTNREPTGDDLLDSTLRDICASEEQRDARHWVGFFSRKSDDIRQAALDRLCANGVLKAEEDLFLWVFKSRRYPTREGASERREVKLRIMSLLFSDEIPEARDIAIVGLADVCGIFDHLLAQPERERTRDRINQIRKLELIADTVAAAVREIEARIAQSMTMHPM